MDVWPEKYSQYAMQLVVNWSDGKEWLYQARMLQSIKQALNILAEFHKKLNFKEIKQFRDNEHTEILNSHNNIYKINE